MTPLTMAERLCMALVCCLLGPALGLSTLHGLNSERTRRGLFGTGGGLLGGLLGGGDKGGGGGLLGGVVGGGEKDGGGEPLGGVVGGGEKDGGGEPLGGVVGGGEKDGGGEPLGGVLGGGEKDGGGGLLGGVLGGGGKDGGGGLLGGVLGGGGKDSGGGLLGGVLGGGEGGGLLGGVGGLLNTTSGVLAGAGGLLNGVADPNKLVDLLTGRNGFLGLTDVLDVLGLGTGGLQEPFDWQNILNLQFIRGSWKVGRGTELILNLQTQIILRLPVVLLRTVTVDVNITADLALTQDTPGELKLVLKDCKNLVAGFTVKLPPGLIALLVNNVVNSAIQNTLPAAVCPIFQGWMNFINRQLQTLNKYTLGILGQVQTALSSIPATGGQFSELGLKDKPFPGFLLKWLFNQAKVTPKIA